MFALSPERWQALSPDPDGTPLDMCKEERGGFAGASLRAKGLKIWRTPCKACSTNIKSWIGEVSRAGSGAAAAILGTRRAGAGRLHPSVSSPQGRMGSVAGFSPPMMDVSNARLQSSF